MDINSVQRFGSAQINSQTIGNEPKASLESGRQWKEINIRPKDVEKQLDVLNKMLEVNSTHIKFILHEELNEYYVQVVNDQTNEVIREIPSQKVMDMVAKMHEMIGLLVDEKR